MAVVFKYKSPLSQTYAPGYTRPGADGAQGIKGESGNALYFIEFDLDNSYNVEQALQKIENNKVISINDEADLLHRTYKVNDILLSNTGKSYRIIKSSKDSLFSNYSFDIEYLGEMHKSFTCPVKYVVIYDFTNATFYNEGTTQHVVGSNINYAGDYIKKYSAEENSCYVTNRTEKPYTSKFSKNNKDYSLVGSWIKIVGYSTEDTTPKFDNVDGISGSKHSFVIQLMNNKNMSCYSVPVEYNYGDPVQLPDGDNNGGYSVTFHKKLEYPNISTFTEISLDSSVLINSLLYELLPDNNVKIKYDETPYTDADRILSLEGLPARDYERYNIHPPKCTTAYVSDYSLDALHPSGNNVKCTINNSRKMWFKSGVNSLDGRYNTPDSLASNDNAYKVYDTVIDENDNDVDLKVKEDIYNSLITYGAGMAFVPLNLALKERTVDSSGNIVWKTYKNIDTSTSLLSSPNLFPQYAIGLSLSEASEDEIQDEINSLYNFGHTYDGKDLDNDYVIRYFNGSSPRLMTVNESTTLNNSVYGSPNYTVIDGKRYSLVTFNGKSEICNNLYLSELDTYNRTNRSFAGTSSEANVYADIAYNSLKNSGNPLQKSNILQFSKYPSYTDPNVKYRTNYKGGNSLYFSGMDTVKDTYTNIFNFITSSNNTFNVVTTDEKTKEMITSVVPIIVDTTFRDSSIYIKFGQGPKRTTVVSGLRILKNGKQIANYTYR